MEENNMNVKAFTIFMKSSQSIQKLIKQDFLKKEINLNEYAIMELLFHRGDQPIQSIGKRILMGGGSITYVIDKLEKKEFLYRKPSDEDRRKVYACITEKGKQYMNQRVKEQETLINTIFNEWDKDEVEQATLLLKRIGIHAESLLKK
ncbi:MarR family transcriptional regulator [Jeotgalibaca sp. MA1X17-3]|uniref:MarR family winged helix-turn-helix transcriptional regulator n=1 Tax=Jeotgalibaca sp. MA1X17-3 TaxID=2908211 RepID=UPI001F1F6399|nr:MarR family transcriptional regulator [Jeotgalibaca sp. MA1X17-3]UJF15564.1 MarR family transcriptional regulator [Jeotgalibaca sp. MA1X17-3]